MLSAGMMQHSPGKPVVWRAGEEMQWRNLETPAGHTASSQRGSGQESAAPVLFGGVWRAMNPYKDAMGGQGVGTRTEVQDSRGQSGAGQGHSHREAASAFVGKHQLLTPSLVRTKPCWSPPHLPGWAGMGQYQGRSRKWPLSAVSPG